MVSSVSSYPSCVCCSQINPFLYTGTLILRQGLRGEGGGRRKRRKQVRILKSIKQMWFLFSASSTSVGILPKKFFFF